MKVKRKMETLKIIFFLFVGLEVLIAVEHRESVSSTPSENAAELSIQAFDLFKNFWNWRLNNAPEFATFVGVHKYDIRLDEMSLNAYLRRIDEIKPFLEKARSLQNQTKDPVLISNLEILESQISIFLAGQKYQTYLWPMNILEGPQLDFPRMLGWMKKETKDDMITIVKRMRKFPQQIDESIKLMEEGIRLGVRMHNVSIQPLVNVLKKMATEPVVKSTVFKPFTNKPKEVKPCCWNKTVAAATLVVKTLVQPAFMRLANFIEKVYLKHTRPAIGVSTLPNGKELYSALLKYHTTTSLNAQQIHTIGLSEVKRISGRMEEVKDKVEFKGSLKEFRNYLRTDPKFNYSTGGEIIAHYKNLGKVIHALLPKYFSVIPKTTYKIIPVPASVAPSFPGAFYLAPSKDGSRPGTFYINTYKPETRKRYEAVALSLHEAEPGHHLQGALTMEHGVSYDFRRFMDDRKYYEPPASFPKYTAYVEGWALYSEYLGEEMGMYKSPYDLFGRLSHEMLRACRLVVDTGMHALGWSRQRAIDFMMAQTAMDLHDVTREIDRYITWPGQACGYKIGEIQIRKLREKAKKALGEKFDLKKFHTLLATMGGVPLDFMERQVDKFIKKYKY